VIGCWADSLRLSHLAHPVERPDVGGGGSGRQGRFGVEADGVVWWVLGWSA